MSTNIGNNESEKFSDYRKTVEGDGQMGHANQTPEDITPDEDNVEDTEETPDAEFKEEINTNFPLSGGGMPPVDNSAL